MSVEFKGWGRRPDADRLARLDSRTGPPEWHSVDIIVLSPWSRWCLLIENKIGGRESPGQLA